MPAGRPKLYDGMVKIPLTNAQLLHLQMRAVAANESLAAVVRHLINKDMLEQRRKEDANAG